MNQAKHWNQIAPTYNDEIFDVFHSDKKGKLTRYFNKHANPRATCIDFGCGNGKAFSYLSPRFKQVLGLDISQKLLNQAKALPYSNIEVQREDLTRSGLRLPKADFIFCCNVAILPTVEQNDAILKNMAKSLKKGGTALLVVPSLESMLYASWRLIEWNKKEGTKPEKIDPSEYGGLAGKKITDIIQGLVTINGVPTKHYTHQELEVILPRHGFEISKIDKIQYTWKSEFSKPPSWMKDPYPWDWVVDARRV